MELHSALFSRNIIRHDLLAACAPQVLLLALDMRFACSQGLVVLRHQAKDWAIERRSSEMINMREEKGTEEFNSRQIPKIRKTGVVVAAVVAKHRSSLATVLLPLRSDGRQSFPAIM